MPTTTAAMLYVLVVVLASALGGGVAGVAASILSFLALNFFFTPPLHTFLVGKTEDLIALVVFLVVSVVTGLLLSAAVTQRARAERRELQTRLLNRFTGRLLSGDPIDLVVRDLGERLVDQFGLARCDIATVTTEPMTILSDRSSRPEDSYELELTSKQGSFGNMKVTPASSRGPLDHDERNVLQGFARQLALALESTRLSNEVKRVEFEAETSRLRAALFSSVTHDLKTPLSVITASVTSLLDGSGFSQQQRLDHLESIRQEADHLNRVVSNLLDLSRLRAGALTPTKTPGAIDELIEAVISRLRPLLDGREVTMSIQEELPEVPMDLVQVDQVLTNLIENAVKFTPTRSPVHISVVGSTSGVRVTVADKGSGVPPDQRERIFLPFERGQGDGVGTGLGLAIARAVIVAHGGRIWAQNAPGGGATFTFELPADDTAIEEEGSGNSSPGR